LICR